MTKRAAGVVTIALVLGALTAAPAGAAKPGGVLEYLGVDECAVDVANNGTVLTRTHLVRHGRVQGLPGGLSAATAMNEAGQVLGLIGDAPVLWDGTRTVELIPTSGPDGARWQFEDLSATGVTVGTVNDPWPSEHYAPFLRAADGTITMLAEPGVRGGAAAVNASGQVAGHIWEGEQQVAVRWEADGTMTRLPSLGGMYSLATGINDAGRAVGYSYRLGGSMEPVLWTGRGVTSVGGSGVAEAINARGDVVGSRGGPQAGFVRTHRGQVRDHVADPEQAWASTVLTAVNNRGLAVGCVLLDDTEAAVVVR